MKWLNNVTNLPLSNFKTPLSKIMFSLTNEQYQLVQENLITNGNVILSWFKPRKRFKGFVELLQVFWRHPTLVTHDKKIIQQDPKNGISDYERGYYGQL